MGESALTDPAGCFGRTMGVIVIDYCIRRSHLLAAQVAAPVLRLIKRRPLFRPESVITAYLRRASLLAVGRPPAAFLRVDLLAVSLAILAVSFPLPLAVGLAPAALPLGFGLAVATFVLALLLSGGLAPAALPLGDLLVVGLAVPTLGLAFFLEISVCHCGLPG